MNLVQFNSSGTCFPQHHNPRLHMVRNSFRGVPSVKCFFGEKYICKRFIIKIGIFEYAGGSDGLAGERQGLLHCEGKGRKEDTMNHVRLPGVHRRIAVLMGDINSVGT